MSNAVQSTALRRYGQTQAARPQRLLEAEVFTTAAGRIRRGAAGTEQDRKRARADARLLFSTVRVLVTDPSNPLPAPLRASIASVAEAALRDAEGEAPDFNFLAGICDDFAAGLSARGAAAP
jgi:hypothetical protein